MAQEDKGLVLRGLFLLAAIGSLVAVVLAMLFWRPQLQPTPLKTLPENAVPLLALPPLGAFPAGVSWYALYELGETMPSAPGWDIRYNAAVALARRGSDAVPWASIREMLNERQQLKNNRVRLDDGQEVYDEAAARKIMVNALLALAVWHEKQSAARKHEVPPELRAIYSVVDKLTENPFVELKEQAQKARATFFRGKT